MDALALSITVVIVGVIATGVLILIAILTPDPPQPLSDYRSKAQPVRPSLRLCSRVLFARRSFDAITVDCTLVRVEDGLPPEVQQPAGLPFTLRLRAPDTSWFAGRIEELLAEWAEDNRELVVELHEERGRVRTTLASGDSAVRLELAGAAGLGSSVGQS